ncbi:helix-turn-helix domain-containing protein [Arcticibacter tournemirensis]
MLVFGTQMHVVTFIFLLLEVVMFFYQLLYYLFRPQDKTRLWYLILLALYILYNVAGGLFPDPHIDIPIIAQNIFAYGSGFLMASYFPYYFYKAFELKQLRFHALYGVLLFLLIPFFVFFVVLYSVNGDLKDAVHYGVIVPFFYSLVLLYAISRAVWMKYKERTSQNNFVEILAVYCAVIPWASMTVLSYFQVNQLFEVLVTNGVFVVITILFISRYIANARIEYDLLRQMNSEAADSSVFELNSQFFRLTSREHEIAKLIKEGLRYREIADRLFISERTVSTHVQHMFEKTGAKSKGELIYKLEHQQN